MSVICRPFDIELDLWSETINLRRDAQWESNRGNVFGTAEEANKDNGLTARTHAAGAGNKD
jgi:hypothetical protein